MKCVVAVLKEYYKKRDFGGQLVKTWYFINGIKNNFQL